MDRGEYMSIAEKINRHWSNDLGDEMLVDRSWEDLRLLRNHYLTETDSWLLPDRYALLTTEQQNHITSWRQSLRDLPTQYDTANEAWDNFPEPETWVLE